MLNTAEPAPGVLLWRDGEPLTRAQFFAEAAAIARYLSTGQPLLNLCERRENFLLAFVAALYARCTQLMPAVRGEAALAELERAHPGCRRISDEDIQRWRETSADAAPSITLEPRDHEPVLVGFTSGSTGAARPHLKRWRALAASVRLNSAAIRGALAVPGDTTVSIVGTVPPHHVYGVEFTGLLPLFANMTLHVERPLFPADVAAVLSQTPRPRVLLSVPLHLRALAESGIAFPELDLVVCGTASLDPSLAGRIEQRLAAPLLEIFGSTETCAIASRRPAQHEDWQPYEGVTFDAGSDGTRVSAAWFEEPQLLQDLFQRRGTRFASLGRQSDLVEVGGKRASLADITRRLCAVPGVEDAVAFQPEAAGSGVANRIAALVVSRTLSAPEIARQVAGGLDAALVPRPLLLVERIPRDPTGKVSRATLLQHARGPTEK